jgi:hypothetical protein
MKSVFKIVAVTCSAALVIALSSCAHRQAAPVAETMEFDPGMKALARELAGQLENSSIGKSLNKVVVDPATKRRSLNKLVVEPFIDTVSGQPVKLNALISSIMTVEMSTRFAFPGTSFGEAVATSEYVITGMVSPDVEDRERRIYKVDAAVYEKSTGVVVASGEARISGFESYHVRSNQNLPAGQPTAVGSTNQR